MVEKDEPIHDWETAFRRNRDRLMRECFGLKPKGKPKRDKEKDEDEEASKENKQRRIWPLRKIYPEDS